MMGFSGIGVLLASQVLSIFAVFVFLGGIANMQHDVNNLHDITSGVNSTRFANAFRGALLVDYAGHNKRQFSFQWWYWSYEITLIVWTFVLCALNIGIRHMAIPMTQSLLAVALSMGIYICNSSLFLYYSSDAVFLFGRAAINALLSGAIILSVSNFISIIALACAMPRPATYDNAVTTHHFRKTPAHDQPAQPATTATTV
jgi:hypothetical protein